MTHNDPERSHSNSEQNFQRYVWIVMGLFEILRYGDRIVMGRCGIVEGRLTIVMGWFRIVMGSFRIVMGRYGVVKGHCKIVQDCHGSL